MIRLCADLPSCSLPVLPARTHHLHHLLVGEKLPHTVRRDDHKLVPLRDVIRHNLRYGMYPNSRSNVVANRPGHRQTREHHVGEPHAVGTNRLAVLVNQRLDPTAVGENARPLVLAVRLVVVTQLLHLELALRILVPDNSPRVPRVAHHDLAAPALAHDAPRDGRGAAERRVDGLVDLEPVVDPDEGVVEELPDSLEVRLGLDSLRLEERLGEGLGELALDIARDQVPARPVPVEDAEDADGGVPEFVDADEGVLVRLLVAVRLVSRVGEREVAQPVVAGLIDDRAPRVGIADGALVRVAGDAEPPVLLGRGRGGLLLLAEHRVAQAARERRFPLLGSSGSSRHANSRWLPLPVDA
mmetsp:Transcript_6236/g.15017  ORF Transcript_6236/g.15017 Transcript_6236/m.15017 type:complete len:356 (-) Transcript_6236:31-1098(-)